MKILAIETSCDETALSLLEASGGVEKPQFSVLNSTLYSQASKHAEFGGVFPALAKREHALNIIPLLEKTLGNFEEFAITSSDTEISADKWTEIQEILNRDQELFEKFKTYINSHSRPNIDAIAVTNGPGLEPALWVGITVAKALSLAWNIPLIPTNHMEGHIASVLFDNSEQVSFPAISLLISGGHTQLVLIKSWGDYEVIGDTRDDAVGEAYDKVARLLGLPYPGGPEISKLAQQARDTNPTPDTDVVIELPRPMMHTKDFDFSLSGLKTAVLYLIQKISDKKTDEAGVPILSDTQKLLIAQEFEQAIVDVITTKTKNALIEHGAQTLVVGGGVIANDYIRENLGSLISVTQQIFFPQTELSTDNATMIGMAGYLSSLRTEPIVNPDVVADGNLSL